MEVVLVIASVLSTLFAAVAAVAALRAVSQARAFHDQDVRARSDARAAEAAEFNREMEARREALAAEQYSRALDQLGRISQLVSAVRDAAIDEQGAGGALQGLDIGQPHTIWQKRMQLELGVATYRAETGRELPACHELATGSTLTHVTSAVSGATSALTELVQEVARMTTTTSGAAPPD